MTEIHAPHQPIHGWRDFLVHLGTITIGLLLALGLDALATSWHHRHLVHQAEASLRVEIEANAALLAKLQKDVAAQNEALRKSLRVLKDLQVHPDGTSKGEVTIGFRLAGFDDVSWKTAQATGALGYMPYQEAQKYAQLYGELDDIDATMRAAERDLTVTIGPLLSLEDHQTLSADEAGRMITNVQTLQGQLYLLESMLKTMDGLYKEFLAHPTP